MSWAKRWIGAGSTSAYAAVATPPRNTASPAAAATQRLLWETLRVVAEPGGCAALAALVSGRCEPAPGETVAVVISGANTTAVDFGPRAGSANA